MSTSSADNNLYFVQNRPTTNPTGQWQLGGAWVIGNRENQKVVQLSATSTDGGKTLNGTMTYAGEEPIGFQATLTTCDTYTVQNQWGGSSALWHPGGTWIIGCRGSQNVVAIDISSINEGTVLSGTVTYDGEDAIVFRANAINGGVYTVQNQWGGTSAQWNPGGTWVMGDRADQNVVAVDVSSSDGGQTLSGTMTYAGEQSIGFNASLYSGNNYLVQVHWGGDDQPWQLGGAWVIGDRVGQNVVRLDISSTDGGATLGGTMTYAGEGPIGFQAAQVVFTTATA
jgi:hypothetical protein